LPVYAVGSTRLDIFVHATPPRSQRTDDQRKSVSIVASFAALRGKCPVVGVGSPSNENGMKYCSLLFLWLAPFTAFTQNADIQQIQQELQQLQGSAFVEKALALSDRFYEKGQYEKAVKIAGRAFQQAQTPEEQALALNKEARAMMKNPRMRLLQKGKAVAKFQHSLRLMEENGIENEALRADNLAHIEKAENFLLEKFDLDEVSAIVEMAFDSAVLAVEKGVGDVKLSLKSPPPPPAPYTAPQVNRHDRREEWVHRIVEMNKTCMATDLKKKYIPVSPEAPEPPKVEIIVKNTLEEVQKTWPEQKVKLQEELTKDWEWVEGIKSEDVREELLLAHYKNRYDSLAHVHRLDSISLVKTEAELKQKKAEIASRDAKRSLMMMGSGSTLLLSVFLLFGYRQQRKTNRLLSLKNNEIQQEQVRNEELLLNILPAEVAKELKECGEAHAHRYDSVTVLFSDFKDFSKIAEKLSPECLVAELDYCFKAFDRIVEKYGLEKIKTIGDSYMCAGGLPVPNGEHAVQAVNAALEMQAFLAQWQAEKIAKGEHYFEARIGIHTGPIVAGVVGNKKFAYDIWGDTVNTASRMESNGCVGQVNISESTRELVKETFDCDYRGKIEVKNKGEVDMYFVKRALVTSLAV
jgi:class 3 adenylate cyclase